MMLGIFGKKQPRKKQNKLPYSFGYAPLVVGLAVIGLVAWWWLTEYHRPTSFVSAFVSAPGVFWKVMALSVAFVISGLIGLFTVWRANRPDRDEEAR